jgi:hypothetical protein
VLVAWHAAGRGGGGDDVAPGAAAPGIRGIASCKPGKISQKYPLVTLCTKCIIALTFANLRRPGGTLQTSPRRVFSLQKYPL